MNLALHTGWLGALEAGAIAFLVGLLAYLASHVLARALRWPEGHAIGWAAFAAVAIGAGTDLWHLFRLFFVNPGSPARAQIALAGIHDPDGLGTRAVMEIIAALGGVLLAWIWFESRRADNNPPRV
ncbi:hypothetical protein [Luteimonas lutimaris]|uniref:Transmembrane protein n=1 Tax=Luteimonas lutimaris TaxID=698645 RepID=A0ABP7MHT7_9GAMM